MKKNTRKGFTITELVIVIAVIAILAAVLIPTFTGVIGDAKETATKEKVRNQYTEYLANFDYTTDTPAENIVFVVDGKIFAVIDGELNVDTTYADEAAVEAAFTAPANKVASVTITVEDDALVDGQYEVTFVAAPAQNGGAA